MSQQAEPILNPGTDRAWDSVESGRRISWPATWILLLAISAILNGGLVFAVHAARGFFLPTVAMAVCCLAGLFDGWTRRIPNPLTYTAILLGLGVNALTPLLALAHANTALVWLGAPGLLASVTGFLLCAVLGLAVSVVAGVHGGDLKLLAAVGALTGFANVCSITLLALLIALAYALVNLAMLGKLNWVLRLAAQRMLEMLYLRRFQTPVPDADKPTHVPMAIPLALASIVGIVMQARYGNWRVM